MAEYIDFDDETWEEFAAQIEARGYQIEPHSDELFISPANPSDPNWSFPGSRIRIVLGPVEADLKYRWVASFATLSKVERPLNVMHTAMLLAQ